MFVATVPNSHNILQMSVLWLNHSISITIYILNSHPGLNIAPANLLYSFRHQSNFAWYYAAQCTPWGEKTTWKNCQAGYKDGAWHREVYGHRPMEYFRQQVIGLLKRREHHGVIYSGDGTQVFRSCKVRQQKREEGQALRIAMFGEVPRKPHRLG